MSCEKCTNDKTTLEDGTIANGLCVSKYSTSKKTQINVDVLRYKGRSFVLFENELIDLRKSHLFHIKNFR